MNKGVGDGGRHKSISDNSGGDGDVDDSDDGGGGLVHGQVKR